MPGLIRMASPNADAAALAAIYAPFCTDTAVTFETEAPSAGEMAVRVRSIAERGLPWLVMGTGGEIAGYVYASPHRDRAAYQWSVDVAAYIAPEFRRQGVGGRLYAALFDLLRRQGYYNAYAGITLPNEASAGLHVAMGFEPVGVYRQVGYKLGAWRDVAWYSLALQSADSEPSPPEPIQTALQRDASLRALDY